jgi:hypothetical protein
MQTDTLFAFEKFFSDLWSALEANSVVADLPSCRQYALDHWDDNLERIFRSGKGNCIFHTLLVGELFQEELGLTPSDFKVQVGTPPLAEPPIPNDKHYGLIVSLGLDDILIDADWKRSAAKSKHDFAVTRYEFKLIKLMVSERAESNDQKVRFTWTNMCLRDEKLGVWTFTERKPYSRPELRKLAVESILADDLRLRSTGKDFTVIECSWASLKSQPKQEAPKSYDTIAQVPPKLTKSNDPFSMETIKTIWKIGHKLGLRQTL